MADLMSGNYKYLDLANKYGNFHVPAVKLKVNGSNVTDGGNVVIGNVRLSLSLDSASTLSFTASEVYDRKNRSLASKVKSALPLGGKVEVELGYLSSTTLVFKGFIAALSYQFQSTVELRVTAMDVRRLMMNSSNAKKNWNDIENYSDIVSKILDNYSELCSKKIDATDDKLDPKNSNEQSVNDYSYITEGLIKKKMLKREFFVLADVAYFREPNSNAGAMLTLEYGESLLSFSRNDTYLLMDVEVSSKENSSQKKAQSPKGASSLVSASQKEVVHCSKEGSKENVGDMAESIVKQKKDKSRTASGSCIGLPEIVPGRYLQLSKLDSDLDGKYYVSSVEHSIGSDGFQTNFEIKGWED